GCNKGGDIFGFIKEVEGISFVESIEILADRAGLKFDRTKFKKQIPKSEKDEYFTAHEIACDFFEEQLYKTDDGKKVLDYLYKRGLDDATIKEFRVGFAPDKFDALYPLLLKKVSKDSLLKSGLISARKIGSDEVYDKFRKRLIFPVFDSFGRVCGFGGRALSSDQAPKYLNSSDSPIYNKSGLLYGLSHAKKYIKDEDKIVIVEGYFDMILPYQSGVKNIVAVCGTALSNNHVKIIKRLTNNVVTSFDTDDAGFEAAKRAYFLFQKEGILVKIVDGLTGKDPADFIKEKAGDFKSVVDEAPDFVTFFTEKLMKLYDLKTLDGRKKILVSLLPCYKQMTPVIMDFFVKKLADRLGIEDKYLYGEIEQMKLPDDHPANISNSSEKSEVFSKKMPIGELIVSLMLEYPNLFKISKDLLFEESDFDEDMKNVYNALADQYNASRDAALVWDFSEGFLSKLCDKITVMRLYAEEKYKDFSDTALQSELEKLIDRLRKDRRIRALKEAQSRIADMEKNGDKDKLKELIEQQQRLLKSN
ncbi:DNA primase, partial [Candidatus Peregrinibacteria bacterium RIFCSPLOWO2_02_FULL_39_10]